MIKKFALINNETMIVENVIMWDEESQYTIPQNMTILNIDGVNPVGVGMRYENSSFVFAEEE